MRKLWAQTLGLLIFSTTAAADLVTYDLVAETGRFGFAGVLQGSVSWDTSVVSATENIPQTALDYWNNTVGISLDGGVIYRDLTLTNASAFEIRYFEGGAEIASWDQAVFTPAGTDVAVLAGRLGETDLYALGGHSVRLPGSPEFPFLGMFGGSIAGLAPWAVAIGDFSHFEGNGQGNFVEPAWHWKLRSTEPVPEPGTLVLAGAAVAIFAVRQRRRRAQRS